ncbi:MAG: carboxypeptidase-like regulatory domain-containing protein [Saprospiraceae bacterium]|nr:carboxypeptidase-like regulatory domain-containing protein [Candidatus Defluviibacterium haderslevense]
MKNYYLNLILLLLTISSKSVFAQSPTQTIRGTIIDKQSQSIITGANVIVMNQSPQKGAVSDINGHFRIDGMMVGRFDLKVSYLGYNEVVLSNIEITLGKEVVLEIGIEENVNSLDEVTVSASKKMKRIMNLCQ